MNVPLALGIPLIVIKSPDHEAETPVGNPVAVPIPVAPVVAMVITGERAAPIQTDGFDDGIAAVFEDITAIVPVASNVPQPPDKGIE